VPASQRDRCGPRVRVCAHVHVSTCARASGNIICTRPGSPASRVMRFTAERKANFPRSPLAEERLLQRANSLRAERTSRDATRAARVITKSPIRGGRKPPPLRGSFSMIAQRRKKVIRAYRRTIRGSGDQSTPKARLNALILRGAPPSPRSSRVV